MLAWLLINLASVAAVAQGVGPTRNAAVGTEDLLGETVGRIAYLDQGWSPTDSQRFYFTPQGSQIIPYDWFLALEQPGDQTLFRANRNLERFRYLAQDPDPMNPDGLPVGFVRDRDQADGQVWLGVTCAACHTAQVNYQGVGYRIDGGPALGDITTLLISMTQALRATRSDDVKFARFAARLPGGLADSKHQADLKRRMDDVIALRDGYNARNFPPDRPAGNGRVDALGAILNEVYHHAVPAGNRISPITNTRPATAATSYPFLWDTPQHDRVQWIGNVPNGGPFNIGTLGRNVGEVLGVFARFDFPDHPRFPEPGYSSSVKVANLKELENWVGTLWSPQWPKDFPPIDPTKRALGERLYAQNCINCHATIDRTAPNRRVTAVMWDAGTDTRTADNFWNRTGQSGKVQGAFAKLFPTIGGKIGATVPGDELLGNAVIGTIVGSIGNQLHDLIQRDVLTAIDFHRPAPIRLALWLMGAKPGAAYKARPLNGIWATAPYLHNGSVSSLFELLLPADQRIKTFHVGSRTFDPEKVGFRTDLTGAFEYRTIDDAGNPIPGNSNDGHSYGSGLTIDQRWALVEYLKSL